MKSLFDIDVILDAFNFKGVDKESKSAIQQVILGNVEGYLLANQVVRLYGELRLHKRSSDVKNIMEMINRTFKTLPLTSDVITNAFSHDEENLKELLIIEASKEFNMDNIVSINPVKFGTNTNVLTPSEFVIASESEM